MNIMLPILALILNLNYTAGFREGDWVNYLDFRFVSSVAADQNTVFFGTTSGMLRYDRFANKWLDPLTVSDGIPNRRIDNIAYDPSYDRVYVSTPNGAAYYQPTFRQWYPAIDFPAQYSQNDFNASAVGILTVPFGYTYQDGQIIDPNFQTYRLTQGRNDGFDHLFTGTWGMGPMIINPRIGDTKFLSFGPYTEDVTALVKVGDNYWFGGGPNEGIEPGISWCDKLFQEWHWYVPRLSRGLQTSQISCGVADGKITWLGTDQGLVRYNPSDDNFQTFGDFSPLPSVEVTSLAADSAWVYVGTTFGLGYVQRGSEPKRSKHKKSDESDSLADSLDANAPLSPKNRLRGWHINCLAIMDGYLFVGSDRGAMRHQLSSSSDFEFVDTPDKMLSNEIFDIAKTGDSYLFATRDDIISVDSKTGKAASITNRAHFGEWHIRHIVADDKNIWAATDIGLWKYRLKDGNTRLFTENDGMISDDVRTIEQDGDYLYLATPKGAIRFFWNNPGRID